VNKYVLNKLEKFGIKIFLLYTDIAIFALRHSILPHPVCCVAGAQVSPVRSVGLPTETAGRIILSVTHIVN